MIDNGLDGQTWEDGLVGMVSFCRWTSSDRRLPLDSWLAGVKQREKDLPRPPIEIKSPLGPRFRIMNSGWRRTPNPDPPLLYPPSTTLGFAN